MKRHGFHGVGASHGAHRNHRKPGSIGGCATPGRVFKGMRMAGRMGGVRQYHPEPHRPRGRRRERPAADQGRRARPQGRPRPRPHRREGSLTSWQLTPSRRPSRSCSTYARPTAARTARSSCRPRLRRAGQHPADPPGRRRPARRGPPGHARHQDDAARSAAVAASRTSRRAPAAPGRARPARRSSPAVAWSTARTPRDYAQRTPKKMKAAALRGALSDRARNGRVHVVDRAGRRARRRRPRTRDRRRCAAISERRHVLVVARARRRRRLEEPAQRRRACTCSSPTSSTPTTCSCSDDVVFTRGALDAFLAGPTRQGRQGRRHATEAATSTEERA